jgi:hypothetical protein
VTSPPPPHCPRVLTPALISRFNAFYAHSYEVHPLRTLVLANGTLQTTGDLIVSGQKTVDWRTRTHVRPLHEDAPSDLGGAPQRVRAAEEPSELLASEGSRHSSEELSSPATAPAHDADFRHKA